MGLARATLPCAMLEAALPILSLFYLQTVGYDFFFKEMFINQLDYLKQSFLSF
jgi:hypothetical protein